MLNKEEEVYIKAAVLDGIMSSPEFNKNFPLAIEVIKIALENVEKEYYHLESYN